MTTTAHGRRLLSFYADDFTGGSASMEVLAAAGLDTVMFLDVPSSEQLARFPDMQAIGIAGVARSRSPHWMRENLPAAFEALVDFNAPVVHYKTCSTFDSSPRVGSIGTAIEIGRDIIGPQWNALVVGAPAIRRYQVFGNLFAGLGDDIHRLDRHGVMRQHPTTPMNEADLGRHLAHQTDLPVGLVDLVAMKSGRASESLERAVQAGAKIVALDVLDDETLECAGELIWGQDQPAFAIGSQGVEYALVAHWRTLELIPRAIPQPSVDSAGPMLAISGSCSEVTARQIRQAADDGFHVINLRTPEAVDAAAWANELDQCARQAVHKLELGDDVLVATASGPDDPRIAALRKRQSASEASEEAVNDRIGAGLGSLVRSVREATAIRRVVIAGGDTSGHAMKALGAIALSVIAPLAPGVPLCRVHSDNPDLHGLEVALKGGQMGEANFFSLARARPDGLSRTSEDSLPIAAPHRGRAAQPSKKDTP